MGSNPVVVAVTTSLKKEVFILAHGFRGFSLWLTESVFCFLEGFFLDL
jgi:hypothetical protein